MVLEDLVGVHKLQGIEVGCRSCEHWWGSGWNCNYIKFRLDGVTYMALEDPEDGYRSHMEDLQIVEEDCEVKLPDIEVLCRMREDHDEEILELLDTKNGKPVLAIGTDYGDGYYPYCVMEYTPENMTFNERNLLAVSIKHTEYKWKFGMPCVLWGHRTKDEEKRSFGGYTQYPNNAEVYSLNDWKNSGYSNSEWMKLDEPVHMEPDFCKKWKKFDTVLVPVDEYIGYCMMARLPLDRPEEVWS